MLHRCLNCHELYVTSRYREVCDYCGDEARDRLELQETDGIAEWWQLACEAEQGRVVEVKRRWEIR